MAAAAAGAAMSDVADAGLDDVPLADAGALEDPLVRIVSTIFSRSAFDSTRGGTYVPRPAIFTRRNRVHHSRSFPGAISPKYS